MYNVLYTDVTYMVYCIHILNVYMHCIHVYNEAMHACFVQYCGLHALNGSKYSMCACIQCIDADIILNYTYVLLSMCECVPSVTWKLSSICKD